MKAMTKAAARILVDKIREEYPNPLSAKDNYVDDPSCYCVGGAFCSYINDERQLGLDSKKRTIRFPEAFTLCKYIGHLNPNVSCYKHLEKVFNLVTANDSENYELAWSRLYDLLTFNPNPDNNEEQQ